MFWFAWVLGSGQEAELPTVLNAQVAQATNKTQLLLVTATWGLLATAQPNLILTIRDRNPSYICVLESCKALYK